MTVYVFMIETDCGVEDCYVFSTREKAIEMLNEKYEDYMAQLMEAQAEHEDLQYEDSWVEDDWVEIEYIYEENSVWTTFVLSVGEHEVL